MKLNKADEFIASCLYKEGVLISSAEINGISSSNKYIGFVNIFNEEFEPLLYNDGNYKNLNDKQLLQLTNNRRKIIIPDLSKEKMPWGLFIPVYDSKDKKNKINVFKLFLLRFNYI